MSQPGWWRVPSNIQGGEPVFLECRVRSACESVYVDHMAHLGRLFVLVRCFGVV